MKKEQLLLNWLWIKLMIRFLLKDVFKGWRVMKTKESVHKWIAWSSLMGTVLAVCADIFGNVGMASFIERASMNGLTGFVVAGIALIRCGGALNNIVVLFAPGTLMASFLFPNYRTIITGAVFTSTMSAAGKYSNGSFVAFVALIAAIVSLSLTQFLIWIWPPDELNPTVYLKIHISEGITLLMLLVAQSVLFVFFCRRYTTLKAFLDAAWTKLKDEYKAQVTKQCYIVPPPPPPSPQHPPPTLLETLRNSSLSIANVVRSVFSHRSDINHSPFSDYHEDHDD